MVSMRFNRCHACGFLEQQLAVDMVGTWWGLEIHKIFITYLDQGSGPFMLHQNSDMAIPLGFMAWLRSCCQWCAPPMAAMAELKLTTSARRVS